MDLKNTGKISGKKKKTIIVIKTQFTPIVLYLITKCVQNGNTPIGRVPSKDPPKPLNYVILYHRRNNE